MKLGLAFLTAVLLAGLAHGQSREGNSDDYLCTHGAHDDARTIAACGRLQNTGAATETSNASAQNSSPQAQSNPQTLVALKAADAAYRRGDMATAFAGFKALSAQGYAPAESNLGFMYANGYGVARDDRQAIYWYQRAAAQGFVLAQKNMAALAERMQASAPTPPDASADLQRGQSDRVRYEAWFHGLTGDYLAGATYWEANRSVRSHAPCTGPGSPSTSSAWTEGCLAAQSRLSPLDQLRKASPDYRAGWNHPPAVPTPAADVTPPPEQSSPPADPTLAPAVPAPTVDAPPVPPAAPVVAAPQSPASGVAGMAWVVFAVGVLVVGFGLAAYFFPTLIAAGRKKRNTAAIFALNLFLGWTLLGWVLALIWSLSVDPNPTTVSRAAESTT